MPERGVNGIRLYYEEHGEGDAILCIHGTASSALIWGDAIAPLAGLGRVVVYDRRGCTRSERPDPYPVTSVPEHADDAAALLDALDATPAIVIGRSYGGEVALDLALRYPDRVRALVLLEAALLNLAPGAAEWARGLTDRVHSVADSQGVGAVGETFIRAVLGDAAWERLAPGLRQMFTDNSPAILAEFNGGFYDVDAASLSRIDQATLLVAGAESPEAFRQATRALDAALPNARTVLVESGHLIDPAEPAVIEFIEDILGTSRRST